MRFGHAFWLLRLGSLLNPAYFLGFLLIQWGLSQGMIWDAHRFPNLRGKIATRVQLERLSLRIATLGGFDLILHDKRELAHHEKERERHYTERFKANPGVG